MQSRELEPDVTFCRIGDGDGPLYQRVVDWATGQIESCFEHGQRFYTERELIHRLGVSQPTVRRAMLELVARGLIQRHVGKGSFVQKHAPIRTVGVIVPLYDSPVLMEQIAAIADACGSFGCKLTVHHLREGESPRDMARSLGANPREERMVLLGHSGEVAWTLFDELDRRGFHSVCAAPFLSGYPGHCVSVDPGAGVRIALDHLTSLGHRRIAIVINEAAELAYIQARISALRREIAARKLHGCAFVECEIKPWGSSFEAAMRGLEQVFRSDPRPTAILPLSGVGAWATLRYAGMHGIRVPSDVSVFSFDDIPGGDMLYPALTGLKVNRKQQAESLLSLLWADDTKGRQVFITPCLVERESTAPL